MADEDQTASNDDMPSNASSTDEDALFTEAASTIPKGTSTVTTASEDKEATSTTPNGSTDEGVDHATQDWLDNDHPAEKGDFEVKPWSTWTRKNRRNRCNVGHANRMDSWLCD